MPIEMRGSLQGEGLRVAVVVARFNDFITSRLLDGATAALSQYGVVDEDITVVSVPGSFELPFVAKRLVTSNRHDAVVCLGAVIRGETDHYEHVAGEAAKGIGAAGVSSGVPVIFGVLTTDTVEQAINRAGGKERQSRLQRGSHRNRDGESREADRCGIAARWSEPQLCNYLKTKCVGRELPFDKLRANEVFTDPMCGETRRSVF